MGFTNRGVQPKANTIAVLKAIHDFRNENGGLVGPSIKELAGRTSMAMATVHKKIHFLIALNLLDCIYHGEKIHANSLRVTEKGMELLDEQ